MNRKRTSLINSLIGMMSYAVVIISTMVTRALFARILGAELLGLNGLFASLMQILQISELGIGAAIVVFLYEPVKNNNKEKIKTILNYYKTLYNVVIIVLLMLGILVQIFVLPNIIKVDDITVLEVQLYFFLYLLGVVSTYFLAYTKSLFYAEMNNKIISMTNAGQKIFVNFIQIYILFEYENYYLFLLLLIIGNLCENLFLYRYIIRKHIYLNDSTYIKMSIYEKNNIREVMKPIFVTRVADKISNQSNAILINHFINLTILGMYSNYYTIYSACLGLFTPIGSALTSAYGNLAITANAKERYDGYKKSISAIHFLVVIFSCLYVSLIEDFINIMFGQIYVLDYLVGILMGVNLYLTLVNTIFYSYQNALGMQIIDQKFVVAQALINIVLSMFLVNVFGLLGLIMSNIIVILIFGVIIKGYIIYKEIFKLDGKVFLKYILTSFFIFSIILFFSVYFNDKIIVKTIYDFVYKSIKMMVGISMFSLVLHLFCKDFRNILFRFIVREG